MPNKAAKKLIEFNCRNGVYSVDSQTVNPLGYLVSNTLDKSIATKEIYGDGELQLSLLTDKGMAGTLEMTSRDDDFEMDLGFIKEIAQGIADVQVLENKTVAIGYETYILTKDGITKTKKVWLLGVNVAPASDSVSQNTDTINEATASYGLTVKGVNLKNADGSADYVDSNGNTLKVFKISSVPGQDGYDTFLQSVPIPKVKTEAASQTT